LAGILLAAPSFLGNFSAVAQNACGNTPNEVPVETQETLKGDVEGRAQMLTKLLGAAQVKGAIETGRKELYEHHQNLDQHQVDMYFMWVSCQVIMSDKTLPTGDKIKLWNSVKPTFTQKIASAKREQSMGLPNSEHAEVIDTKQIDWGGKHSAGLHKCSVEGSAILCSFVITNLETGEDRDYDTRTIIGAGPRLVDNFHVEHQPVRSYFLNGRGKQQEMVNLAENDSVWFVIEFENGSKDITKIRIISDGAQFSGSVE
jgi:hypothetical protein